MTNTVYKQLKRKRKAKTVNYATSLKVVNIYINLTS